MPQPRQDKKVDMMYTLYLEGHSLAKVAAAFGVSRQSVYKMFALRKLELRQRPEPLQSVIFNGEKYTLRKVGYYGKTRGQRSYLHRDVWEHHNGPIPVGYDIHHRDGDKTNNRIGNLELIDKAEHARLYGKGQNQFTKGRGQT